jgi:chloride channel protein, CIC family
VQYSRRLFQAAMIGLVSGLACVALRKFFLLLQWCFTGYSGLLSVAAASLPPWRRVATPVLGAAVAFLIVWLSRRVGRVDKSIDYVEAVRFDDGHIPLKPVLWRTLSSSFSVASGAAIGREGSMIQFAAGIISFAGRYLRVTVMPLSLQVACGVAAAVTTVYQAPIAGIFFAMEIVLGSFVLSEIPPLITSALAGVLAGWPFLEHGPLFRATGQSGFDLPHLWLMFLLAVLIGAFGPVYYWIVHSMTFAKKWPLALLWSGAVVGIFSLRHTEVWGNGDVGLFHIVQGSPTMQATLVVLVMRLVATTFCAGTGTVGGVFTPTLFAGASIGLVFGRLVHASSPVLFAILGMCCLLAAATHAPWMSLFMAIELTGRWTLMPLLLPCTLITWQIASRLSSHALYAIATSEPEGRPSTETKSLGGRFIGSFLRLDAAE